jgi:hypothetical protein
MFVVESYTTFFPLSSLALPDVKDSVRVDGLIPLETMMKEGILA